MASLFLHCKQIGGTGKTKDLTFYFMILHSIEVTESGSIFRFILLYWSLFSVFGTCNSIIKVFCVFALIELIMLGEKAMELVREAARARDAMGPFNEDKVMNSNCTTIASISGLAKSPALLVSISGSPGVGGDEGVVGSEPARDRGEPDHQSGHPPQARGHREEQEVSARIHQP